VAGNPTLTEATPRLINSREVALNTLNIKLFKKKKNKPKKI